MAEKTPKQLGYRFPAEWEPQAATWLSWAHKLDSWPEKFEPVPHIYTNIVRTIARFQHVNINVNDDAMFADVTSRLTLAGVPKERFTLYRIPTNDAWCRDHGPAFVVNPAAKGKKRSLTGDITRGEESILRLISMMLCRQKLQNSITFLYFIRVL